MIILYHANHKITAVKGADNQIVPFKAADSVVLGLHKLAEQFREAKIVWCHEAYRQSLNIKGIESFFHHRKMMLSYNPSSVHYMDKRIGYVEESPFINVNKKVTYPTWQMSSAVGVIHASVLTGVADKIKTETNFDYYLNSLAKVCMPLGLFCYTEPKLLLVNNNYSALPKANMFILFRFVKQHYKTRWVFLLLLNFMLYERKFPFAPFLISLFYRNRTSSAINLAQIKVQSSKTVVEHGTIDVIIPTIGRKAYLYDVLCDLRRQTHLPVNVIIVEQNPIENSVSELDYLTNESWPFTIKHSFTHQAGACNARNVALSQIESEWVFLADDDNRFDESLLAIVLTKIQQYGASAITTAYLQQNEIQHYIITNQSGIFGSGNSFLKASCLPTAGFDPALEFGYGEDTDFGLELRNKGVDVIYFPELRILHLRAPIGGFRIKPTFKWSADNIQPKPSPSIMYVKQKHDSKEQIKGYKTVLFLKLLKSEGLKNPMKFLSSFQKKWNASLYWFDQLVKVKQ